MKRKLVWIVVLFTCLTGCEEASILTTPKKSAYESPSHLTSAAENRFWNTLHAGNYRQINDTERLLTAAYLENPTNPKLAALLGFLHTWKITERERSLESAEDPTIINSIVLAKRFFADAVSLAPNDARLQGFLGDTMMIEGAIFHDEREEIRGYYQILRAIKQWPEFNLFTGGFVLSSKPAHSSQFQEGLDWQWRTLDLCAGTKVDRQHPDFSPYMHLETQQGPKRACWNSWVAPHNFEGFFLNMGDMLVKNGEWETAITIYKNAKLSRTYSSWPYRDLLEKRIANAKANVAFFQELHTLADKTILFNSGYGCVACHQQNSKAGVERNRARDQLKNL